MLLDLLRRGGKTGGLDGKTTECSTRISVVAPIRCMTYSEDADVVFSGCYNGTIRVYSPRTFKALLKLAVGTPILCSLLISTYLWVGTSDGCIRIFQNPPSDVLREDSSIDIQEQEFAKPKMQLLHIFAGHSKAVKEMILIDPSFLNQGPDDGDTAAGPVSSIFEPDCQIVWTASDDGSICVWKLQDEVSNIALVRKMEGIFGKVLCLSQVGGYVWSGGGLDNVIMTWNATTLEYAGDVGGDCFKNLVRALLCVGENSVWSGSLDAENALAVWQGVFH